MNSIYSRCLSLALLLALAFAGAASAAPGDLDRGFGNDGTVVRDFGVGEALYSTAVTPSGKVIVAGYARVSGDNAAYVAAFGRNGRLDRDFGQGGRTFIDVPGSAGTWAADIAIAPGGKLIVGLTVDYNGLDDFALVRLTRNGDLDDGFGTDGMTTGRFAEDRSSHTEGIAITADGGIVVAGGAAGDLGVARLTADGDLDSGFAGDGTETTDAGGSDWATDVAVSPGGKVVVSGVTGENVLPGDPDGYNEDIVVARYGATGDLDSGFAGDGIQTWGLSGPDEQADAVAVRPDGGVVAVGRRSDRIIESLVVRLGPNGEPMQSFGAGGGRILKLGGPKAETSGATDVAIDDGNRIVVGGWASGRRVPNSFALARLRSGGELDRAFGRRGRVLTSIGNWSTSRALALAPGRIVVAGSTRHGDTNAAVARYRG